MIENEFRVERVDDLEEQVAKLTALVIELLAAPDCDAYDYGRTYKHGHVEPTLLCPEGGVADMREHGYEVWNIQPQGEVVVYHMRRPR